MGIREFFEAIAGLIGWALLIIAFGLYIAFREYFETIPKFIVVTGMILVIFIGVVLILLRNASRSRQAKAAGSYERIVHVSQFDEMKHDIVALLTFGLIITWILFTGNNIDGNDFAQAAIGYTGVMLVRKIYKERYY